MGKTKRPKRKFTFLPFPIIPKHTCSYFNQFYATSFYRDTAPHAITQSWRSKSKGLSGLLERVRERHHYIYSTCKIQLLCPNDKEQKSSRLYFACSLRFPPRCKLLITATASLNFLLGSCWMLNAYSVNSARISWGSWWCESYKVAERGPHDID